MCPTSHCSQPFFFHFAYGLKINFAVSEKVCIFAAININDMETQVVYTITTEPTATRIRKVAKSVRPIPEGYVSAEEFNRVFEQKIRAAYEKL